MISPSFASLALPETHREAHQKAKTRNFLTPARVLAPMKFYDVAVVGSGIAGLTSAALLAHSNLRVVCLESHDKVGGCAGYFEVPSKWGQFRFPTGATVALGLQNGGLHAEIFQKLGVTCPSVPVEKLAVYLPDLRIDLWHDNAKWRAERQKLPGNRAAQEAFWRLQELVADAGWFALGRKAALPLQNSADLKRDLALAHPRIAPMILALPFSVGELMKWLRIDRDRAFCALINLQLLITTQSLSHAAPLGNGMAGLDLWRHGAHHPRGGLGAIAQTLHDGFEKHGGEMRFGARVVSLRRDQNSWEIETQSGEIYRARRIVANMAAESALALLKDCDTTQKQLSSAQKSPNLPRRAAKSWGAITLYGAVRDAAIPADFPLHAQILERYHVTAPFLKGGAGDDVFLSLSLPGDLECAPTGFRALNISTHVRLADWQNLTPLEYRAKKREWRDRLLKVARIALPDLPKNQQFVIAGTPTTWEDYTLRPRGGVGGTPLTRRNSNLRAAPSRLGVEHFQIVGDGTFPGQGTVACALSGYNAWRDIMD